ncbi:PqqD family protein [candidate division KSB1 bacterium]|nr:PqqD family protein [candidate division KSB1 bacterium]
MKNKKPDINLLDVVPVQTVQFETDDQQQIVLIQPKFTHQFMVKHVLPRLKKPNYRITLDKFGSTVWNYCDGKRSVADIAECLLKDFGDAIEPVHDRLGIFIRTLKKNRFIDYRIL